MRPIEALPEGPLQFVEEAALVCAVGAAAYVAAGALRALTFWRDLRVPALLRRGITLLGATVALSSSPAVARSPRPLPARAGVGPTVAPPWSDRSGPPPQSPLGSAGGAEPLLHPALHPGRLARVPAPLFRRTHRLPAASTVEKQRSMAAHPAGRNAARRAAQRTVVVRDGDTLWGLAAEILGTDDVARIAGYWPAIHRHNREVIGPDPNLIRPGQVLQLPPERS